MVADNSQAESPPVSVAESPPMSVLVCTRNRAQDLAMALPGILAQDYRDFEVVVIDQSTNGETEALIRSTYAGAPRLRYIATNTSGLSRSRNLALESAQHDICAFTDDDCEVPANWLSTIASIYAQHSETHVLYGPVHAPAEMVGRMDVQVPSLYFDEARVLAHGEVFGMGANMSMRRSFWCKVGPFDSYLGAGAPMPGAEEYDWLFRAHRHGAVIRLDPRHVVIHRASRSLDEWARVLYCYGTGDAAFALKHVRCGELRMLGLFLHRPAYIFARLVWRLICRARHEEQHYLRGYWNGIRTSRRYGVDRNARLFVETH